MNTQTTDALEAALERAEAWKRVVLETRRHYRTAAGLLGEISTILWKLRNRERASELAADIEDCLNGWELTIPKCIRDEVEAEG